MYPAILPCLLDVNVASRKDMGTKQGLDYANNFKLKCKINYNSYYVLKCDISKFFASIDHDILKKKLLRRIKDKDALKIVFDIIDSNDKGLYIGSMTSQILAIFHLNDMDHFIKEDLKIKYYVRYQDDFLLFHESKQHLRYCLKELTAFLKKEHLTLNRKTRIYKNTNNFLFLGRNSDGKYARYRNIKRKLKSRFHMYKKIVYYIVHKFCCFSKFTHYIIHYFTFTFKIYTPFRIILHFQKIRGHWQTQGLPCASIFLRQVYFTSRYFPSSCFSILTLDSRETSARAPRSA